MIIKFSNLVSLSEWKSNTSRFMTLEPASYKQEIIWSRHLIPYKDYDNVILVSVRKVIYDKCCYANFYSQLKLLREYFPENIEGDLSFAKDYVDNFLIRMSNLKAYL